MPRCLIMSGNVIVGYQVASLLDGQQWRIDVVHSDFQARDMLLTQHIDVVVADIDTDGLGGLAFLALCRHWFPEVTTYGIVQVDDAYGKRMGRDAGGCEGFFYLKQNSLHMDLERGMAAAAMGRVVSGGS